MTSGDTPSAELKAVLGSAIAVHRGLDLRVTGGALRQTANETVTVLSMELDTTALPLQERNGTFSNEIELAFVAVDAGGSIRASNRSVGALSVTAAEREKITRGLRYMVEFPLPAGRFEIRAAARESVAGTAGSAVLDIDTRALNTTSAQLGVVLITTPKSLAVPTTGASPRVKSLLPWPPTARRLFEAAETLLVVPSVVGTVTPEDPRTVAATIRAGDGAVVFSGEHTIEAPVSSEIGGYSPSSTSRSPVTRPVLTS